VVQVVSRSCLPPATSPLLDPCGSRHLKSNVDQQTSTPFGPTATSTLTESLAAILRAEASTTGRRNPSTNPRFAFLAAAWQDFLAIRAKREQPSLEHQGLWGIVVVDGECTELGCVSSMVAGLGVRTIVLPPYSPSGTLHELCTDWLSTVPPTGGNGGAGRFLILSSAADQLDVVRSGILPFLALGGNFIVGLDTAESTQRLVLTIAAARHDLVHGGFPPFALEEQSAITTEQQTSSTGISPEIRSLQRFFEEVGPLGTNPTSRVMLFETAMPLKRVPPQVSAQGLFPSIVPKLWKPSMLQYCSNHSPCLGIRMTTSQHQQQRHSPQHRHAVPPTAFDDPILTLMALHIQKQLRAIRATANRHEKQTQNRKRGRVDERSGGVGSPTHQGNSKPKLVEPIDRTPEVDLRSILVTAPASLKLNAVTELMPSLQSHTLSASGVQGLSSMLNRSGQLPQEGLGQEGNGLLASLETDSISLADLLPPPLPVPNNGVASSAEANYPPLTRWLALLLPRYS
jgi:hypothetical protein